MKNEEHELARADREFEERISLPPSPYVWVMDSECCEMCNGLLDYFGQCPHCGWDSVYGYDWDDSADEDDIWYGENESLAET